MPSSEVRQPNFQSGQSGIPEYLILSPFLPPSIIRSGPRPSGRLWPHLPFHSTFPPAAVLSRSRATLSGPAQTTIYPQRHSPTSDRFDGAHWGRSHMRMAYETEAKRIWKSRAFLPQSKLIWRRMQCSYIPRVTLESGVGLLRACKCIVTLADRGRKEGRRSHELGCTSAAASSTHFGEPSEGEAERGTDRHAGCK